MLLTKLMGLKKRLSTLTDFRASIRFETTLPADASGSYAVGSEARRDVILNEGFTNAMDFREQVLENPVFYFSVDGTSVAPRRTVVTDEKCETCHDNLSLHGENRHEPEYCVTCHLPEASDVARRPDEELPVESIHFKYLIHRIHRGHELTRDFTVYGFGNSVHDYTEVHYPGDLRDCESCHVNDSYTVPLPANLLATPTPREFFSPLQPIGSACLSCHDSESSGPCLYEYVTLRRSLCCLPRHQCRLLRRKSSCQISQESWAQGSRDCRRKAFDCTTETGGDHVFSYIAALG
jgi:OmcA/MtrC family decaheme c-type cytochrome